MPWRVSPRLPIQCAMVIKKVGGAGGASLCRYAGLSSFTAFANSAILPRSKCKRPSGPHWPMMLRSISAMCRSSEVDQASDQLAVPGGVPEGDLRALRALEVEMHVVLPGEADSAVNLDAIAGRMAVRVGAVCLGHGRRERRVRHVVRHRPTGVVRDRLRALHLDQHVGALVLDRLKAPDRPAELLADLRVLDRHVEDALGAAAHLGAEPHLAAVDDALEKAPPAAEDAEDAIRGHRHAL